ncbi:DUF805 domain-containing protein [Pedobacter chinensis]|uniref:DUF805 domain-containing protein n=1 Tax=Pedobacter chinensis TaxID=2282421 RepID=A0A369PZH7_9SPHI|nr:DUF805 domain-containing protein [Pedobacter chinensis]RDC57904.1 DUF805 domain-containing protein [Pedobacter chinensis]
MFKDPFSFEGRIRRLEYGLSIIIYIFLYFGVAYLAKDEGMEWMIIFILPFIYVMYAQGAKRCHDIGASGWWQFFPFYFLIMLFSSGNVGRNKYGNDPKDDGKVYPDEFGYDFRTGTRIDSTE